MNRVANVIFWTAALILAASLYFKFGPTGPADVARHPEPKTERHPRPQHAPEIEKVGAFKADAIEPGSVVELLEFRSDTYHGLVVSDINSDRVTLRGDREIVSVPVDALPKERRQQVADYLAGLGGSDAVRAGSAAFPQESGSANDPMGNRLPSTRPLDRDRKIAGKVAREKMETWLRVQRKPGPMDVLPVVASVDIEKPMPMSDADGKWRVRGRGYVASTETEMGGLFYNLEVIVSLDADGKVVDLRLTVY